MFFTDKSDTFLTHNMLNWMPFDFIYLSVPIDCNILDEAPSPTTTPLISTSTQKREFLCKTAIFELVQKTTLKFESSIQKVTIFICIQCIRMNITVEYT